MSSLVNFLLGFSLVLTALFLILLVLIQRGRGGGLAGALGGMGGQSAFGTKAGDVFTKITVGVAGFWILLCILSLNVLGRQNSLFSQTLGSQAPQAPAAGGAAPPDMTPAAPETKPADAAGVSTPAASTPAASAPAESAPATPKAASDASP